MTEENIKKSHKKRGMTLAEVIISIAVMAVLALLLTTVGVTIDTYRKDTKARNQRISQEGPAAETLDGYTGAGSGGLGKPIDNDFEITVNGVKVSGKLYSTSDSLEAVNAEGDPPLFDSNIKDADGNRSSLNEATRGHFKFIRID